MKQNFRLMLAAGLLALSTCMPAKANPLTPEQKTEVESLIRSYLLENPEILREMAEKLESNDKQKEESLRAKALVTFKDEVFKSGNDPVVGNAAGDVTVVEFMDYNCGWCKKSVSELADLIKSDTKVRIVLKEFPIFGEHSEYAARAALAAAKQGKYWELHQAMFAQEGQVTIDVVNQLAETLGLNMDTLKADIGSKEIGEKIAANMELGKNLAISGTPAFVVDGKVYGGYLPLENLQSAIAEVRANGCKLC